MERQIRAMEIFRHRYGIAADPEHRPYDWAECLAQAAEEFEFEAVAGEFLIDEGGEG
jgi:hypothetical protein